MQWRKHIIIVQKLTLVVKLWAFCIPIAAIARAHNPTVIASVALRKGLRRYVSTSLWLLSWLMFACGNSPLWQRCERCNNVLSSFWPPWLDQLIIEQRGHHVTCALIGTSRQWAAYNYTISLVLWKTLEYELMDANGGIQKVRVEPATRSAVATCCTPGRGKIVPRNLIN